MLGMARGIPRPSILEVPDLFLPLDSPRNRFCHSSDPRGPRQNFSRTSKLDKIDILKGEKSFSPYFENYGFNHKLQGFFILFRGAGKPKS